MKKQLINLLILGAISTSCSKKSIEVAPKAAPVKMARAIVRDVPSYIQTVGHMEAFSFVNIMAQADGRLIKTYFQDGADVNEGDLLFLIDQRPYLASLKKAEGALEESRANLMYDQRTVERNSKLVQDEYISQDTFDNLVTTLEANEGVVKQNKADVDTAEINLGYTTIYSPINARAGERFVYDGNLILESGATTLVTLNQITPIYASFFINEKDLPRVQRYQKKYGGLKTVITLEDPEVPSHEGTLSFIDNGIDLATGMIKLKSILPNEDKVLWPNQYVQVTLVLETLKDAVLIPFEAVQNNSKGKYVYVIKGSQTVEMRQIEVGQMQEDNTIVVLKGIKENERVVKEGQINLYDGAKVRVIKDFDEDD